MWVVAQQQTQGRGRRGRVWQTPSGNLAASLVLETSAGRARAATLGFVAGLALNAAIAEIAPEISTKVGLDGLDQPRGRLTLKWPNDVLADGAKLAGILLEIQETKPGELAVVIGMGVNIVAAPEGLPYPVTSLADLGSNADAKTLFSALTDQWVHFQTLWNEGQGLGAIRQLWLDQAAGLGAPVSVALGDGVLRGRFETLDEEGRLIIVTDDGARQIVAAGEVHFGVAAKMVSA